MVVNIVDVGWATIKSGCLPITAAKYLYWSIFIKAPIQGLVSFKDIWSMMHTYRLTLDIESFFLVKEIVYFFSLCVQFAVVRPQWQQR